MIQTPKRAFIVDGNWYINRIWSTMQDRMERPEVTIPKMMLSMVCRDAVSTRSTHVAVAFDGFNVFRKKVDANYKSNRKGNKEHRETELVKGAHSVRTTDEDSVYKYLPDVFHLFNTAGIHCVQYDEYEADDLLSSAAVNLYDQCSRVTLGTIDKDLYQVVNDKVNLYGSLSNPPITVNEEYVLNRRGVRADQMLDYQTLLGDATDNILGFKNLGPKTIVKILQKHDTLQNYLKSEDGVWLRPKLVKLKKMRKMVKMDTGCWKPNLKDLEVRAGKHDILVKLLGKVPTHYSELCLASKPRSKGLF